MAATGASILPASLYPDAGLTKGAHTGTSKGGSAFIVDTSPPGFSKPSLESTAQASRFYASIAYSCLRPPFQATPHRLNFSSAQSPSVESLLSCNCQSLHQVSLHVNPFPIAPAPERQHRPHLRSPPLAGPSTSVSNTRFPLPKSFGPLSNQSALQVSAEPCRLRRSWDLQVSANHCPR
jgi:hypothetical protein